ncbi:Gfo/Idh/MocA family oxidoreductase [Seonamhaeicola sp. NFXS20]|uniref:Gfo/Idh/MocA family protein n=1 Tax=Seonamhaeicola sp. NFXS20 TaxID=2816959 RepID=UPI003B8E513B
MTNNKLNVGVVGAGWWATYAHIPGIIEHERANLSAIFKRDLNKAKIVAQDFGADQAFDDYKSLILMKDLDAVIISSTPNMHYEHAKFALEQGKHVLMEKPMTITVDESQELCALAANKKLEFLVSCPWHYTKHGIEARKLIKNGELGLIKMISILMTNPIDKLLKGINTTPTHEMDDVYQEPNKGSYNDPSIAGGGQIYCQVSHAGAYLSFLTDAHPKEVYAKFDYAGSVNDIYDALTITMDNGTLVNLASTGATPTNIKNYEVRIFGTKGVLLLELWKGTMEFYPFHGESKKYETLNAEEIYPHKAPVLNFIDACLGLDTNGSKSEHGLAAMKIIEAACTSNNTKKPVKIKDL